MKRIHFTSNYLLNPTHPVTVNVIGAGGTGSQVITNLGRIHTSLVTLGKPGLFVSVYDPDIVSESNIGRQLFSESEIGLNKAMCMVSRINKFFGTDWKSYATLFPKSLKAVRQSNLANLTITCTDNVESRVKLGELFYSLKDTNVYEDYMKPFYWLDFGNSKDSGQAILGTVYKDIKQPASKHETVSYLKVATELIDYSTVKEEDSGPSCSHAEALNKQDLFINSSLAMDGCNLFWRLLRQGFIDHQGFYKNLATSRTNPIWF